MDVESGKIRLEKPLASSKMGMDELGFDESGEG